jgi:hypothetical protein
MQRSAAALPNSPWNKPPFRATYSLSEEEIALSSFAYPSALHKASETPTPAIPSDKYPKSIPE